MTGVDESVHARRYSPEPLSYPDGDGLRQERQMRHLRQKRHTKFVVSSR